MNADILREISDERERQVKKFGLQNHQPAMWVVILGEEYGEVCRATYESKVANDDITLVKWMKNYREELVQTAAVAVAAIECLDRHVGKEELYAEAQKVQN